MDKARQREWDSALADLMRAAQAAGVSDSETRLWKVQHIDSSLSRLVRETEDSMVVIADGLYSPGSLLALIRMYPPRERKIFSSLGLAIYRKTLGFKLIVSGAEYHIDEMTMFQVFKALVDEYNHQRPRVM